MPHKGKKGYGGMPERQHGIGMTPKLANIPTKNTKYLGRFASTSILRAGHNRKACPKMGMKRGY